MKRLFLIFMLWLVPTNVFSQEPEFPIENEPLKEEPRTKIDIFMAKAGDMVKLTDYGVPKSDFYSTPMEIRKIELNDEVGYFCRVTVANFSYVSVCAITHEDMEEVINAIDELKSSVESDMMVDSGYLEKRYTTSDGFRVGYTITTKTTKKGVKKTTRWYISSGYYDVWHNYHTSAVRFVSDMNLLKIDLVAAKTKIEELMQN